jgi:FlaA1/EpsC-like NDP-sugar epimerase
VIDVAKALIGDLDVPIKVTGIRPGEKIHEIMVSEEEAHRTVERGRWYAIRPMLPEVLAGDDAPQGLQEEYSSARDVMTLDQTRRLLEDRYLMLRDTIDARGEVLR